jgi:hypothetical protein
VASEVEVLFGFVRRLVGLDHPRIHELEAMPKNPTEERGGFYADDAEGHQFSLRVNRR